MNIGAQHPRMATIDHLRSRYDETRREKPTKENNDPRTVLACHACNDQRNEEEQGSMPKEELTKRSRRVNQKRRRRRKNWFKTVNEHFTEKIQPGEDHDSFNKQIKQLHLLVNHGAALLRREAGLPHWTDGDPVAPKMPDDPEEIKRGLQAIAAEIKLALTGEKT